MSTRGWATPSGMTSAPYAEGVQDLREGVHDLIIGNHEGVRDIAEGLHDLLIRTEGTPFHEGLQDLNEGFHDLTVASNPEGFRDIYEGLSDLAAALLHSSNWA